jgi:4,5-DOPA dioxygenase extradiol
LDFALEFDALVTERLEARDFAALTDRSGLGILLRKAHPRVDHYLPALTVAGASDGRDALTFMTDQIDLGSISMRSFIFYQNQGRS